MSREKKADFARAQHSALRLAALDTGDLAAVSLYIAGAELRAADIVWRKRERRLVIGLLRCGWEQNAAEETATGQSAGSLPRAEIPAVLDFAHVLAVRGFGFDKSQKAQAELLQGLAFRPSNPPGGVIEFLFAGGKAGLQCDVECIELRLEDLPPQA